MSRIKLDNDNLYTPSVVEAITVFNAYADISATDTKLDERPRIVFSSYSKGELMVTVVNADALLADCEDRVVKGDRTMLRLKTLLQQVAKRSVDTPALTKGFTKRVLAAIERL